MVERYGFGDASGTGFGSSWMGGSKDIGYTVGVLEMDKGEEYSNFKELSNLVNTLEGMREDNGDIGGTEIFLFTYNSVAEGAIFKVSSTSEKLFDLVLRLKMLEVEYDMILHFCHVTETIMIENGTDGLSRGNLLEGIMLGVCCRLSHYTRE